MTETSRRRRMLIRAAAVALSVFITLAFAEIALRLIGYNVLQEFREGQGMILRASPNPDLVYELAPGTRGFAWDADIEVNAGGYRGRMASPGKLDGFRIVAIGDSITFGNGLPYEATYPNRLHELLNGGERRYEALNLGVGGYDIVQEIAMLEDRGLALRPDFVALAFCLNDAGIASPNLEYIHRMPKYRENAIYSLRLAQLVGTKLDRLFMRNWTKNKNRPEVFARDYAAKIAPIGEDETELAALMAAAPDAFPTRFYRHAACVGRVRWAFQRLAALAKQEGFATAVVVVPWLEGSAESYPQRPAHEIVEREARAAGLGVIDARPAFFAEGLETLRLAPDDLGHPGAKGHEILAKLIAERVKAVEAR